MRPLQVDPPTQFLNSPGGVHPIHDLAWDGAIVSVDAKPGVRPLQRPEAFVASTYDGGSIVDRIAQRRQTGSEAPIRSLHDPQGLASGALLFDLSLAPGAEQTVDILATVDSGEPAAPAQVRATDWVTRQQDEVAQVVAGEQGVQHVLAA